MERREKIHDFIAQYERLGQIMMVSVVEAVAAALRHLGQGHRCERQPGYCGNDIDLSFKSLLRLHIVGPGAPGYPT